MEDKIEVGEYVRIDKNKRFLGIGKVIKIVGNTIYLKMYIDLPISFSEEELKGYLHSKKIEKLIKEGDYVNGMEVYRGKVASGKEKLLVGNHIINGMALELVNIKSIVTKEQIEALEYKI